MMPLILALLIGSADARRTKDPPPPERPALTQSSAAPTPMTPGSLWSEVPARQLMGLDANARQVGDLITVHIMEQTSTNLEATTDTSRSNTNEIGVGALFGMEKTITKAHPNMGGQIGLSTNAGGTFSGDGTTTRDAQVQGVLTAEVIEVLPGGNLRIWGYKRVRVNRETQYVVLEGVVRPRDIQMDNTVSSELLAQAKVEITGSGVLADRQGPGMLTRVLDWIWPF